MLGVECGLFNDPFNFQEHATMRENNGSSVVLPSVASRDVLSEILREGAQRMLAEAVQAEVDEWIDAHRHVVDERGRQQVVRNGSLPKRSILTGLGEIEVEQPRGMIDARKVNENASRRRFCRPTCENRSTWRS